MTTAHALTRPPTTTPPAPRPRPRDHQLLAALPSALGCARRFVRHTLEQQRAHPFVDLAEAVVTELVSDAVAATGTVLGPSRYPDLYDQRPALVDVRLHRLGARVVIEVEDPDPTPPWPREPAQAGADPAHAEPRVRSWTYSLPPAGGKVVRVELEIPPDNSLADTGELTLPRRAGPPHRPIPPAPARLVAVMTDPVLLQRVLNGLRQLRPGGSPRDEHPTGPDTARKDP